VDKRHLIGVCICVVVLLILGSLSNVVGYQSMESTTVNDSPLFTTRTHKATNQHQNSITSQYLGVGKENLIQFPIRDNKTVQLKKVAEFIRKMDDKTFERFIVLCIQRARQDSTLSDINSNEIIRAFKLLRTKPEMILNSFINTNYQDFTKSGLRTCIWAPGCIFGDVLIVAAVILGLIIIIPLYFIFTLFYFTRGSCTP